MSDPRRSSDELLLRLLRENQHDAEIAVKLGISTGQLRERKRDLRNRLGEERWQELLGQKAGRRPMSPRLKLFLMGGAVAAGVLAMLLGIANIVAGDPEEEPLVTSRPTLAPTTVSLAPPTPVDVEGRPFLDLGPFVIAADADGGLVGTASNRLALVAMELRRDSFITSSEHVNWNLVNARRSEAYLRGTVAERQLDLLVLVERPNGRLRTLTAGVGPLLAVEPESGYPRPPILMIAATQGGAPVEVRLTPEGRLLLGAVIPANKVVDSYTGGELDVSGAQPFGRIPVTVAAQVKNTCDPGRPGVAAAAVGCDLRWQRSNRGFTVPFDGTFSCSGARTLLYDGGGVRLQFTLVDQPTNQLSCEASSVSAGTAIVPDGIWEVHAQDAEGTRLAIAVALDGTVYVGVVKAGAGCPCLPRS
jgi:hypothetical protein